MCNCNCFKTYIYVIFLVGIILVLFPTRLSARINIIVNDQSSFDGLKQSLSQAIKSGDKEIFIHIYKGIYFAKENHISLYGIKDPELKIHFLGDGAIITPIGQEYKDGDKYAGDLSINSCWTNDKQDIKTWSDVRYAKGLIDILDEKNKLCRIKCNESNSKGITGASYVLIPHWYLSSIYKIDKIEGNYIYFTASDLKISNAKTFNVNDDFNYGKKEIRYKLFNASGDRDCIRLINGRIYLPIGINAVREGIVSRYFVVQNCAFNLLEITGISFCGNSYEDSKSALFFYDVNCQKVWIHKSEFNCMRGNVLILNSSHNVFIENNIFSDCYYYGIQSNNLCKNTIVRSNTFSKMGRRLQSTFCVACQGENYIISDNKFFDYGYGSICVGVWYNSKKTNLCSGVIEANELSYTDDYLSIIDNYSIMDSGAIYVFTKNDGTIIRNNYIHGYSGMADNRGIFCDDGAYNYQIYGNIITGIANSYCIDSRRVSRVEKTKNPNSEIDRANVNIEIRDNIVDGRIRFEAHEGGNNGCVKGANYILMKKGGKAPKNTIMNIVSPEEDIPLDYVGTANGKFYITSQSYRKLKKSKGWNNLRKHVGKF